MIEKRTNRKQSASTHDLYSEVLREKGVLLESPYDQDSLVLEKIADGIIPIRAINRYNYRAEHVYCCACGKHTHYKGITVLMPNEQLALIGNCCAKVFFGKDAWTRIERELKTTEDRIYYETAIRPLSEVIQKVESELEKLITYSRPIDAASREFSKSFPELWLQIRHVCKKQGGRLIRIRTVIDHAKIEREKSDHRTDDNDKKLPTTKQVEVLGMCDGTEFASRDGNIRKLVLDLRSTLDEAAVKLSHNPQSVFEMREIHLLVRDKAATKAHELIDVVRSGYRFFGASNIAVIAGWANKNSEVSGKFWVQSGRLVAKGLANCDRAEFDLPTLRKPPHFKLFDILKS